MSWQRFIRLSLLAFGLFGVVTYVFILVLDPYENVPFSPALPRAPVSQNQRYAYPALARRASFDSAIIGTSMVRLLKPQRLNALLGAHFVNLSMNSATAYEQLRMNELFIRHHPRARFLIYALDDSWCRQTDLPERYTFRDFPEFMFDENPWNDLLYLFNDKALENAVRMLELLRGDRDPKYGTDGYFDFTEDFGAYDLQRSRQRIYGTAQAPALPAAPVDLEPATDVTAPAQANLSLLPTLLAAAPADVRIVVLFPPMHAWHLRQNAAAYRECKARALVAMKGRPDIIVLDYLLDSSLTRQDEHYWDGLHYGDEIAIGIEQGIAAALAGGFKDSESHRLRPLQSAGR